MRKLLRWISFGLALWLAGWVGLKGYRWVRARLTPPVADPTQHVVGKIDGQTINYFALVDTYAVSHQETIHELVFRQLILIKAKRFGLEPVANDRKSFARLFGKVLAAEGAGASTRELQEIFHLQMIRCAPDEKDFLSERVLRDPFEGLAEQFSQDRSRFKGGNLGPISAASLEKDYGTQALQAVRATPDRRPTPPVAGKKCFYFFRTLSRSKAKGLELETFLVEYDGWNQMKDWTKKTDIQVYGYKYDEKIMAAIFRTYLTTLKE